ncbi:MAG: helix-turn-helix transcriptional regulator [Pseudomonadota bacterium]
MTTGTAPQYLTTRELADLLRVKERRVYELAAAGEVPCSRVTGKLLFPADAVKAWIEAAAGTAERPRPAVVLGSHDPLLNWALRESGSALASYLDGSRDGLDRFAAREGIACGLHVFDPAGDAWNVPAVRGGAGRGAVLVAFARRRRGLVVRPGEEGVAGGAGGLATLAGRRVVRRQAGAGAEILFAHLAARDGLDPATLAPGPVVRTEAEAAMAVLQGEADAALGLEALAAQVGLAFVPVIDEAFDLLVDRQAWFEPPMQRLIAFCASPAFVARAAQMPGYDVATFGQVRWNDG